MAGINSPTRYWWMRATIDAIANMRDISPLHNPPQAATIRASAPSLARRCRWRRSLIRHSMPLCRPRPTTPLRIPSQYYEEHGVRRYGFHGTSHRYVSGRMAELLGEMPHRLITCHLAQRQFAGGH